jgi:C1A family cysteine protease
MQRRFVLGITILALVNLFFLSLVSFALAEENDKIEALNSLIKAKKARWNAKKTSLSNLPSEKQKRLCGALFPELDEENMDSFLLKSFSTDLTLPSSFDWRDKDGKNFVTSVKNQGDCGSCWAFASVAALESQVLISTGWSSEMKEVDLSEEVPLSCNCNDNDPGDCDGGYMHRVANFFRDCGTTSENSFYYTEKEVSSICTNWQDYNQQYDYKINSWQWVAGYYPSVEELKEGLYQFGPLVVGMDVYYDFFSYGSGVYSHVNGTYAGGHAILLIGWDDNNNCFIAKNSWGTDWGEDGFFRISYDEVGSESDCKFGQFAIAYNVAKARVDLAIPYLNVSSDYSTFIKFFNDSESNATVNATLIDDNGATVKLELGEILPHQTVIYWASDLKSKGEEEGVHLGSSFAAKFSLDAFVDQIHAVCIQKSPTGQRTIPVYRINKDLPEQNDVLTIPYICTTLGFSTFMKFANFSDSSATLNISAYPDNGDTVYTKTYDLPAKQVLLLWSDDLQKDMNISENSFALKIEITGKVGEIFGVVVQKTLQGQRVISIYKDKGVTDSSVRFY